MMDGVKVHADCARPAKIVLERRVRPGARPGFTQWLEELMAAAARAPNHQGSSVFTVGEDDFYILLRFATQGDLERWQAAAGTAELLHRGDVHALEPGQAHVRSGLETWFTVPGRQTPPTPPPRWKMALVTWLALLPQALVLGRVLPPSLPTLVRVSLATAIPVAMLTWVLMPRPTKRLYGWLYARAN